MFQKRITRKYWISKEGKSIVAVSEIHQLISGGHKVADNLKAESKSVRFVISVLSWFRIAEAIHAARTPKVAFCGNRIWKHGIRRASWPALL